MRFQIDHDWQGNMSSPRTRVGDGAKTQLLLLLCAIWILIGLIGHDPWKPLETIGISTIKGILDGGSLIAPLAYGETNLTSPPLYHLAAALSAHLLDSLLNIHDAARLTNAIWMSVVLLMVGMTGRELWARGSGRHATFIMIGTIGLITSAHSLNTEIAGLASSATGFYALSLSKRRPWRASVLLGAALSIGFLTNGLPPLITLLFTALLLPIVFKLWRTRKYLIVMLTAIAIAIIPIAAWLILFFNHSPLLFIHWINQSLNSYNQFNHVYFLRILIWYAWPALPLALWSLWLHRHQLMQKPKFQLILTFFILNILVIGLGESTRDIKALPLLLPLVALGAGCVEHLKREAVAALNWFGITLFGTIGFLIWLGWVAMITGYPAKIKERLLFLSGTDDIHFNWLLFIIALAVSMIWLSTCIRSKYTNKSAITNWAVGMTLSWSLLMTLWLPLIDSAKSYQSVFLSLNAKVPSQYNCINSLNVGQPQRLLLNYHTNIKLKAIEVTKELGCDLYLIQDVKGSGKMQPSQEWKLIWRGKRSADRKESFRLYQIQH